MDAWIEFQKARYHEYMVDCYNLLTRKNPKFPKNFNKKMKIELYNKTMKYFEKQENFKYCAELSQSLNDNK